MEKMILIDGNSLVNRAFYATPLFTTKDGFPTNGIMGFVKLFLKIVGEIKPKYAVVAFDMHAPTFRHKMFTEYKGTRKPMPQDLVVQMPVLKECLKLMNVKTVEKEGVEADDIIGSLSRKFSDVEYYIYTGDRDAYQLVKENVRICYTLKGVSETLQLTEANFKEKVGLLPYQIIELKSLMGDSSDNIPGIPGIGEKMAKKLLEEYESLDEIYAHLDDFKGALRKKLEEGKDIGYLSHELATIDTNVDLDVSLEDCLIQMPFSQAVRQKFAALEFRLLYANESLYEKADAKKESAKEEEKNENFPDKVITVVKAEDILDGIGASKEISVVFGEQRRVYFDGKEYEIAVQKDLMSVEMPESDLKKVLRAIFADKEKTVYLFRAKEMMHFLKKYDIPFAAKAEDLSILRYLVDFTGREEELGFVLDSYGYPKEFAACSLYRLCGKLHKKLSESGMESLYYDIELPVCEVLYHAEYEGVCVNEGLLRELGAEYKKKLEILSEEIYKQAGESVATLNLNSPSQLGKVLFGKLGLPKGKKSKNGAYSVSVEVLENLAPDYKIVQDILDYRQIQKLSSTYVEGLKVFISEGKVHTNYTQTVTSTGRLSSKNPNLQNIPIRTEVGREIRKLFVAKEGCVLVDADYSQIELRLMAHLSGCKGLIEAFQSGKDVHSETAAKVYGVPLDQVTGEMRRKAKAVNFGLIYGESAFGLAKNLKIRQTEAADFINRYFAAYPEIKEYQNKTVEFARENGYAVTLFGRKREFPELKSNNYAVRQFGERAAMNMPLQGTSADIIKLAMLSVYRQLKEKNMRSKLILQVHDELVLESPEEEAEEGAILLKNCMENVVELSVPLTVEVGSSRSWYDAK